MTWVRVDDQFHSHPKVLKVWKACEAAIGLHLLALSHASAYLTDGRVSEEFVALHVPSQAKRRRVVAALLGAGGDGEMGLWEVHADGGWQIHDYLDYNESREKVLARRRADSVRKNGRKAAVS